MPQSSIPQLSQYLRRLTSRYGDASTDHELLQRFVSLREEAAFTALVERHAAMVLGLCRSILRNHHDAEDIFQAAFLVLARKAASIRKGESAGSWLHAVAYRLAHKARVRNDKRRLCEQQAPLPAEQSPMDAATWAELRDILHEEVSRLPEKYRAAVVLCYWEGRTHEQAGQQLGCARSTIKDRLEKAREMLRKRLARRGLALSAAWFAASLSEGASAAVSAEMVQTTVRGAMLFSMGQVPAGAVSAAAADCARRALQTMLLNKLKYGLALVLVLGVFGGGVGLTMLRETATPAALENEPAASVAVAASKPEQDHVDANGDPLPPGTVARLGTLRFRHADSITRIAAGTDGTSIFSAAGNTVYVWDFASGKERRRFAKHKTPVTSFVVSRDSKLLASACRDGTIHLWDAATGRELCHFTAHKGKATDQTRPPSARVIGFTPDGQHIVSVDWENTYRLWNAATGEQIREVGRFPPVVNVSLSPDGKTLVGVVKKDKTCALHLWEVATGRERIRRLESGKQIFCPTFSPDGKMLAMSVGAEDWQKPCDIQLWDANADKAIRTLHGHKGWAWFAFSPDGKTLASTSSDNTNRLWDVATGGEIGRIGGDGPLYLNQLLFCADGRTMVSYTQVDHQLRLWDRASGKEARSFGDAKSPVDFLTFSPDGKMLATGSNEDWIIRLWDVSARKTVRRMDHELLTALQLSPDGRRLASAGWTDSQVRIWEVAGGKELRRIPENKRDKRIGRMAWSGDGKVLATTGEKERLIRLWQPDTGKQLRQLSTDMDHIASLVFSPDSKILAAFGSEDNIRPQPVHFLLWAVDTGRLLRSLEVPISSHRPTAHARVAFSPDGRTLALGGQGAEASIYVWELASGRLRFTLKHGEDVACLAFSPDGKLLAAANNLNMYRNNNLGPELLGLKAPLPHVHIWDVAAEKEIHVLKGHRGLISVLAFSPDGKLLATGSCDTTVLLWDTTRFKTDRPVEVQLRSEQMESLWADLGGEDAVRAYRAIRTLATSTKPSVAFLKQHLHPVEPADAKKVARLLADLDSDRFDVRQKAMQQLEKLGESAAAELHKALAAKPALEVKRRIEQSLEKHSGEHVRMVRALETLERIGTSEARDLCARLADGVADAPLTRKAQTTLRRMAR